MLSDDDPGWPIKKGLLLALVPGGLRLFMRRRRDTSANGLIQLRQLFLSFWLALIMFGVVLAFLWPEQSKEVASPGLAIGLLLPGVAGAIGGRFVEKPLVCTSDASLAASYRVRFFLRIAFAESAALFGFVGFFTASEWWVYPAGAAIAFVGFARAAPTRTKLRRDQERMNEQGCFRSLTAALIAIPPISGGNTRAR